MPLSLVKLYGPPRKKKQNQQNEAFAAQLTGVITSERLKQGISQKELAERSNTPQSTIARILAEKVSSKIDTLLPILEALGYTLAIVPLAQREDSDVFIHKNKKNVYDELNNALSILSGIVNDMDNSDKAKALFNLIKKQYAITPERIRNPMRWDKGEYYEIYQDIILAEYNKPLSVLLEVVRYNASENESEKFFAFIKNDIIGSSSFGSHKFEHYFSQIKFYLEGDDNAFQYNSYSFLDKSHDDPDFISYLHELLDYDCLDINEIEIVKIIAEEGYDALRPWQKIEFIENVLDHYYVSECEMCGVTIPWCEMLMAATEDSLCGYCRHRLEKLERE